MLSEQRIDESQITGWPEMGEEFLTGSFIYPKSNLTTLLVKTAAYLEQVLTARLNK